MSSLFCMSVCLFMPDILCVFLSDSLSRSPALFLSLSAWLSVFYSQAFCLLPDRLSRCFLTDCFLCLIVCLFTCLSVFPTWQFVSSYFNFCLFPAWLSLSLLLDCPSCLIVCLFSVWHSVFPLIVCLFPVWHSVFLMTVCLFPGDILSFPWLSVSFLSNILSFYWLPVSFLCLTVCLSAWMCFSTWLSASFLSACFISRLPFLASSLALFSHTDFFVYMALSTILPLSDLCERPLSFPTWICVCIWRSGGLRPTEWTKNFSFFARAKRSYLKGLCHDITIFVKAYKNK